MYYINENIKNLYRILDDQNGRKDYLRLDWNENPIGLPKEFVDSIEITPEEISMYPETKPFLETLSGYLGIPEDYICLTNGSIEGIRHIIEAFSSIGGKVVGVSPSYPMYKVFCDMYDRKWIDVKYDNNYKVDIRDLLSKLTADTQLLCLMNPNNPIGDCYSDEDIELILKLCKELNITVLIDEAYYLFNPKTLVKYSLENDHIFITRSFSKLFSMAGCRLGYVIGRPENLLLVKKLCDPDNVNFFSLKVGKKLLENTDVIHNLITQFNEGKEYLLSELDRLHYKYIDTNGNFILIKPNTNTDHIVMRMKNEKKILIRKYNNINNENYLRVTISDKDSMKRFIDALVAVDEIRVITYGTFDLYHYGHQRILERAKQLGDYLIVGVTSKEYDNARGKTNVIQSLDERIENIKNSGFADKIIVEEWFHQKEKDFEKYAYDILTLGDDWKGKCDYLEDLGCKVIYLPRTEGISSSILRDRLKEAK